jgi:hypothetical protein
MHHVSRVKWCSGCLRRGGYSIENIYSVTV